MCPRATGKMQIEKQEVSAGTAYVTTNEFRRVLHGSYTESEKKKIWEASLTF
jgi:hypothetical protein